MASAPASKRARVSEPQPFNEIDVTKATLKVVEGKSDSYYVPLFDNESVRIILTAVGPTKIAMGFDMKGAYEQRSFNSPGVKAKASESLSIRVELDKEQVKFLEMVETRFKSLFPESNNDVEWSPLISFNERYQETNVKVNVCLSGEEADLTSLKFKQETVHSGRGWDFLKERAAAEKSGAYAFGGGEVKVVAKLRAWTLTGKDGKVRRGISLAATQLFIKPREKVVIEEPDVLEEW
jgi:hypothetical protein